MNSANGITDLDKLREALSAFKGGRLSSSRGHLSMEETDEWAGSHFACAPGLDKGVRRTVAHYLACAGNAAPVLLAQNATAIAALQEIAGMRLEDAMGPNHLALCMKEAARKAISAIEGCTA